MVNFGCFEDKPRRGLYVGGQETVSLCLNNHLLYVTQVAWVCVNFEAGFASCILLRKRFFMLSNVMRWSQLRRSYPTNSQQSVLDEPLKGREWLVGPHYSLVDMKTLRLVLRHL